MTVMKAHINIRMTAVGVAGVGLRGLSACLSSAFSGQYITVALVCRDEARERTEAPEHGEVSGRPRAHPWQHGLPPRAAAGRRDQVSSCAQGEPSRGGDTQAAGASTGPTGWPAPRQGRPRAGPQRALRGRRNAARTHAGMRRRVLRPGCPRRSAGPAQPLRLSQITDPAHSVHGSTLTTCSLVACVRRLGHWPRCLGEPPDLAGRYCHPRRLRQLQ
mmetsp:Transcript_13196/g.35230  ORF Transcript_13196/g.35230 Transcript_13196/m.35230 type:complete len:217 (+) Transcript_13196:10-660(+)